MTRKPKELTEAHILGRITYLMKRPVTAEEWRACPKDLKQSLLYDAGLAKQPAPHNFKDWGYLRDFTVTTKKEVIDEFRNRGA